MSQVHTVRLKNESAKTGFADSFKGSEHGGAPNPSPLPSVVLFANAHSSRSVRDTCGVAHSMEPDSSQEFRVPEYIQFGCLTPEEVKRYSVCKITTMSAHNKPYANTPYDERMGVLENKKSCATCGRDNASCPGHPGHIKLAIPMPHPKFLRRIVEILKCVCNNCAEPRIDKKSLSLLRLPKDPHPMIQAIVKHSEVVEMCHFCGASLLRFELTKKGEIKMFKSKKKDEKEIIMPAKDIYDLFMKISNETMTMLGFNRALSSDPRFLSSQVYMTNGKLHTHQIRPEAYMIINLMVSPPITRPYITKGDGERCEDDITCQYNNIIKVNASLKSGMGAKRGPSHGEKISARERQRLEEQLKSLVYSLIDNHEALKKPAGSWRPMKGYCDRIKGKAGRVNANVVAKRADFSARSVIVGGGTMIPVGWIGVPAEIAKKLSKKEIVNNINRDWLEHLVNVDRTVEHVKLKEETNRKNVSYLSKGYTTPLSLKNGDVVYRPLHDGDWVIFNRQPTLRVESMLGVQIMVMHDDTEAIRLPLPVVKCLNADTLYVCNRRLRSPLWRIR